MKHLAWNVSACYIILECSNIIADMEIAFPNNVTSGYSKVAYFVGGYVFCVILLCCLWMVY